MDYNRVWSMLQVCREGEKVSLFHPLIKASDIMRVQAKEMRIWLDRKDSHEQFMKKV